MRLVELSGETKLTAFADVVILTAMGEEAAVEAKEAPKQG